MPRRYAPDGTPLFNGKMPEEFNAGDIREFMAETDSLLHGKENDNMATNTATATQAYN